VRTTFPTSIIDKADVCVFLSSRLILAVGERSYTELKCLGDGSFGTVWLCDWQSPVRSGTHLSAMQCGAGARPEWAGKRLVALKRMKRVWEGGWKQAKTLGELVVSAVLVKYLKMTFNLPASYSLSIKYLHTPPSFPCTTLLYPQNHTNSTLSLNAWKATSINSRNLDVDDL